MADKNLRLATLSEALKHEGVREQSENWGPEIKAYLAAANVKVAAPWCAAFCNYVAEVAAKKLAVPSPLEAVPNQAYVQSYVDHGKKKGWVVPAERALPGDLFALWFPSLHRYGHIGIVTATDPKKKTFSTIEGNTNDDGSREGYEVAKRTRPISPSVVFLRWA